MLAPGESIVWLVAHPEVTGWSCDQFTEVQPVRLSVREDEPLGKETPLYCETDFCLAVVVYSTWFGRFHKLDLAKENWLPSPARGDPELAADVPVEKSWLVALLGLQVK